MHTSYRGNQDLTTLLRNCRQLRRCSTDAEQLLWQLLRGGQIAGCRFRRQHQYGPYILDFYCVKHKLAIEADGGQHFEPDSVGRDTVRTEFLEARGIRVLRFTNVEILKDTEAVVAVIWQALGQPSPS